MGARPVSAEAVSGVVEVLEEAQEAVEVREVVEMLEAVEVIEAVEDIGDFLRASSPESGSFGADLTKIVESDDKMVIVRAFKA